MKKEVKYIGFYDLTDSKIKRVSNLAATYKMDYICDAIIRAGYKVHLVSPSWFADESGYAGFHPEKVVQLGENKKLTFCPSFGTRKKWARNIKIILTLAWLFFWLLKNTRKGEKILVYHTPWLSLPVRWAKWIRCFNLTLEVEEVYRDVSVIHPYFEIFERKLITSADAYFFSTELLTEKINTENKPYLTIYGVYKNYPIYVSPPEDGKIHLLYSGIIDTHKAGAFNAVECTPFLPMNYVLYIVGFGETEKLLKRIEELNKTNECKIIFDGVKSGNDFIEYAQRCHIGLSTQKMAGKYLETSFPSKILAYLSLGLEVVSCNVDCVAKSQIGDLMSYYAIDKPEEIAKAIMAIDLKSPKTSREAIEKLDREFVEDIKSILSNV